LRRGETLTHLVALGTLSRGAGEGLQRIHLKAPLPHRGRGGTKPAGLVGEGSISHQQLQIIFAKWSSATPSPGYSE